MAMPPAPPTMSERERKLVIVLEGLSAGIQALRLNYYEFFSRYFTGKGVAYEPVALKG